MGLLVRRKAETHFKPEVRDAYIKAVAWLDFLNRNPDIDIQHLRNTGSVKRYGFDRILSKWCSVSVSRLLTSRSFMRGDRKCQG